MIIIMQDGGQDGCHNHTVRGILLLKRHSGVSYNQYLVIEMPIFVVHIIVKSFGFS